MPRYLRYLLPAAVLALAFAPPARGQDVNEETEKAMKAAAAKAAPWVVKIETSGGGVKAGAGGAPAGPGGPPPGVRKGSGPTTGLVVGKDGYIITSSFNFANKPTDIFVTVPGKDRKVAKVVSHDTSRMLTLLKADYADLPVPDVFPKKEMEIGQWTLAQGRALDPEIAKTPGFSRGILSATGRVWGKAIQCDSKVGPVNYGGPVLDISGSVMGVLVPATPDSEGETAGVEWYDSGIGFAIPLEDVMAVLPRLKQGKDLGPGKLGFNPKEPGELYNAPVTVGSLAPDSAAAKIGLRIGDVITSIDGKPVPHFSALKHVLGPKYEGDLVDVTVRRGDKEEAFKQVALGSANVAFAQPFFGILPMRDDPEAGVEVRFVYPKSGADLAGLKAGDRILKFAPPAAPQQPVQMVPIVAGGKQFEGLVRTVPVNYDVKVEVKRKEGNKTETLTVKLGALTEELPEREKMPYPSTKERALEKPKAAPGGPPMPPVPGDKPEPKKDDKGDDKKDDKTNGLPTGLVADGLNKTLSREYWMYVPDNYDKNKSYGVVVWLHSAKGGNNAKDMKRIWENYCDSANFILIGPKSKKAGGWVATETEEVVQTVREAVKPYTVDWSRVIVHGMGDGGQMGLYMSFAARDLVRGAAVTGAALGNNPKDNLPNQPLAFFLVAGDKDPLVKEINDTVEKLKAKKFPVIYREIKEFGKEYIDQKTLNDLCVWLDSLDRI